MTAPEFVDPRLAGRLRCWHMAPASRPGSVALTGREYFANGDGVTVLVRASGDEALASDGGHMVGRLADAGVDVYGQTRAAGAWDAILEDYRLVEMDGRIVGRRPLAQAEQLVSDVAGAMLTTDGLRWMVGPRRDSQLVQDLYRLLDRAHLKYDRRPTIQLPKGTQVKPTARVAAEGRAVLVQVAGQGDPGVEHALSVAQRVERANYGFNQRLTLLNGTVETWAADHLDLLADHSPVAFSADMQPVEDFLVRGVEIPRPTL
ncbi:hypothetical protein [Streptomyces xiamenensis]|uniref:hypothetical protein n=1 Tax=Streptomyces xiamenensis TaxID=408015 RepID=UPI003D7377A0